MIFASQLNSPDRVTSPGGAIGAFSFPALQPVDLGRHDEVVVREADEEAVM